MGPGQIYVNLQGAKVMALSRPPTRRRQNVLVGRLLTMTDPLT
jgi:hypothetical protein